MSALTTAQKDAYALIPDIKAAYEAHLRSGNEMMSLAIEIGKDLLQMKKLLPHGEFKQLVEARFDFSYRSATNYMRIAKGMKKLPGGVQPEDMSIRGLLKLAGDPKSATAALISLPRGRTVVASDSPAVTPLPRPVESADPLQDVAADVHRGPAPVASNSDDPIGDACEHDWDEDDDCRKCKMPRYAAPAAPDEQAGAVEHGPVDIESDLSFDTGKMKPTKNGSPKHGFTEQAVDEAYKSLVRGLDDLYEQITRQYANRLELVGGDRNMAAKASATAAISLRKSQDAAKEAFAAYKAWRDA